MTLCSAMVLGADCIEDCDLLRSGATAAVLGYQVAAPSTLGTFLRAFTFRRAGPGDQRLVVDVDSFVGEVHGSPEAGRRLRVHPQAQEGLGEHLARHAALLRGVDRPGRAGVRDGTEAAARRFGVLAKQTFARLDAGWQFSSALRMQARIRALIEAIDEQEWTTLADYPQTSIAQIAEARVGALRMIVRRGPHALPTGRAAAQLGALPVRD